MEEIWKTLLEYDGFYQISNYGNIKSFYNNEEKLLKKNIDRYGYEYVELYNTTNKSRKKYKIHRLVAQYFCDGYFENAVVNHKDENKLNNKSDNLEWCDIKHNNSYGIKVKQIIQYDKQMNCIQEWDSAMSASQDLNIDASAITKCCRGKKKTYKGYIWKYKNLDSFVLKSNVCKGVLQIDADTNKVIQSFKSPYDAFKNTNIRHQSISMVCKGLRKFAGGYIWKYAENLD